MTETHPITPPPELVQQWTADIFGDAQEYFSCEEFATRAAQWGADQELLACGNYLKQCAQWEEEDVIEFYNYRRPKPPSLKEQALALLQPGEPRLFNSEMQDTLRRALEQLDD